MSNDVEIRVTGQNQSGPALAAARKDTKAVTDTVEQAGKAYTKAGTEAKGFGREARAAGAAAAGVLGAELIKAGAAKAVEGIKSTIRAASDLNESVNAVQDVFHKNSAAIEQWGQKNAEAFGLSLREFNQYATPLGAMLKNAGLSEDQVTEQTIKLTQRAADMASVFNVDVGTALEAIQAGLRGEQDPLEKFGVSLSAAKVQARALADTGKANVTALTAQELATARLNIIYDQTNDTAGDFQNTSTGLANATRKANAAIEDAKANIGAAFLPVLALGAQTTEKFAKGMSSVPTPVLITAAAVTALGAAFVFLAPKIKSGKEALDALINSDSKVASGFGKSLVAIGKVSAALAAVQVIGSIVGSQVFKNDLTPNVEASASSLTAWADKAKLAGEGARLFGDNAKDLDGALAYATAHGGAAVINKIDEISTGLIGMDGWVDESNNRVKAFDATLTYMAKNGQATQALELFTETAKRTGIPIDDLKKALPQFAAAMQVAGVSVENTGAAAAAAAQDVNDLNKSFHDTVDSAFSLADAEDKVANDVARLTDQVKQQKDAHDKGAGSLDRHTQAGRDNSAMLRTLLDDTIDLATTEQQAGRPVDGLKKSFQDQLKALGFTSAQVAEYTDLLDQMIKKLDALPPTVTTNVIVRTSYSGAAGNLGYVHGNASGGIGGGSFPHAAEGGPQMGTTPTMMNEHGGELLHLPWGATVFSSSQSRSMLERGDALDGRGPGGGGGTTELLVRGDGSRFAELLIYVLQQAVSARGGQAGILGIRFAPTG